MYKRDPERTPKRRRGTRKATLGGEGGSKEYPPTGANLTASGWHPWRANPGPPPAPPGVAIGPPGAPKVTTVMKRCTPKRSAMTRRCKQMNSARRLQVSKHSIKQFRQNVQLEQIAYRMPEPCIHDEAAVLDNGTTAICHKAERRGKSAKTARPSKRKQKL